MTMPDQPTPGARPMTERDEERIELGGAYRVLRKHQRQLDADGCMVGVSRQALDEVLDAFAAAIRPSASADAVKLVDALICAVDTDRSPTQDAARAALLDYIAALRAENEHLERIVVARDAQLTAEIELSSKFCKQVLERGAELATKDAEIERLTEVARVARIEAEHMRSQSITNSRECNAAERELARLKAAQVPEGWRERRDERAVEIDYTNWRGERSVRTIFPTGRMVWGPTEHHPDAGWLIEAIDPFKGVRVFDPAKIHRWGANTMDVEARRYVAVSSVTLTEYLSGYELVDDNGGGYTPTDCERGMLEDFGNGLLSELQSALGFSPPAIRAEAAKLPKASWPRKEPRDA